MEKKKKYAAYGSNLNTGQMSFRCPAARITGQGVIKDYEMLFRGCPTSAVATIAPKPGAIVPVLIWEIDKQDERNLDYYEGYPHFYEKKDVTVTTADGTEKLMAYIMHDGYQIGVPGKSYHDCIEEGYREAGFDTGILNRSVECCRQLMISGEKTENRTAVESAESMDKQAESEKEQEDGIWQQIRQP
jgi:gamma-glutamylcyclotransferase (GGCT)/AIG2-like uncharacterized protein YtfP